MSLALVGTQASYEFRWRRWALLRDAIATHLEGSVSGSRFAHFASIGGALGGGPIEVPAKPLASELGEIRDALAKIPVTDLVLGPITARVLYPTQTLETARPLTNVELAQLAPIGDEKTLDQYFSAMLGSMLEVCEHPMANGMIEVHDG